MKKKYYIYEMNLTVLNIISVLLFVFTIILTLYFYKIGILHNWKYSIGIIFILMIPYLILHEVLHSVSYVLHGAKYENITFGAHLELGLLCCLCKQNITRKNILMSLIYPFFFIGVLTYIIGIMMDWPLLIALSIINISGCAGDLIMFLNFLRIKNFEYSEFDNPIAFALYSEKDLSKRKMFGLKYLDTKKELKREKLKKVTISKTSIIFFIIILIVGLLYTYL